MIIFGTRGIASTITSGRFHCPQCAEQQPYRKRKITKFFTLYFIPLIPQGKKSEYVECLSCKATFYPKITDVAGEKQDSGVERTLTERS